MKYSLRSDFNKIGLHIRNQRKILHKIESLTQKIGARIGSHRNPYPADDQITDFDPRIDNFCPKIGI